MKWILKTLISVGVFWFCCSHMNGQSLGDLARQESEKKAQKKKATRIITNEDIGSASAKSAVSNSGSSQDSANPSSTGSKISSGQSGEKEDPERNWSKRFLDAKAKLKAAQDKGIELQNKLNDLNRKLLLQSDIYDREHLLTPMIADTQKQLAQNKESIQAAQQELESIREELRRSGDPVSWENSEKALQTEPEKASTAAPAKKDQQYWQSQLNEVDKKYDDLIHQLEVERFQLLNRRPPSENESLVTSGNIGMGAPPCAYEIDQQIKDLRKKQEQEKTVLREKAINEGALPGWFR